MDAKDNMESGTFVDLSTMGLVEALAMLREEEGTAWGSPSTVLLVIGDSLENLPILEDSSREFFKLVATSPPYYAQRNNGCQRQVGLESRFAQYKANLLRIFSSLHSLLDKRGSVYWQIGDKVAGGGNGRPGKEAKVQRAVDSRDVQGRFEVTPSGYRKGEPLGLAEISRTLAREAGFYHLESIVWSKGRSTNGPRHTRLGNSHEHILRLARCSSPHFDLATLRRDFPSLDRSVWELAPESNALARSLGVDHTSIFPPEIPAACMALGVKPGDWVLDPFGGLGTTALAAARYSANCVIIEQNETYAMAAVKRLNSIPKTYRPSVYVVGS